MEAIKENSRLVVAILVTVGVLILLFSSGDNSNTQETTEQAEAVSTTEVAEEQASIVRIEDTDGFVAIGVKPEAGAVVAVKDEGSYTAVVRPGDSQTLIARQIVNDYLSENDKNLSAEQRLYMETNLVKSVGSRDIVIEGDEVTVNEEVIVTVADQAEGLTEEQIERWSEYL